MRLPHLLFAAALTAGLALGALYARSTRAPQDDTPPPLPAVPQAQPIELVEAQPFVLDRPGVHTMRAERPAYTEGYLLVLRADPALWRPRQGYENVLYVGAETATRVNTGEGTGYLVVLVPGPFALEDARVFLGEPELPERVDKAEAERQLALAVAAGVTPLGSASKSSRNPAPIFAKDEADLYWHASYFVERYAPDERDVVTGLRAPRLERR